VPKLLVVADVDRLDAPLTVAQMTGAQLLAFYQAQSAVAWLVAAPEVFRSDHHHNPSPPPKTCAW
jgi:hypothetical protein